MIKTANQFRMDNVRNEMETLVHKHIIIRAEVLNPPLNELSTSESVKSLINNIGMKILMGPYAKYCEMQGNRGLTVATIIETSHIVMHTWDEPSPANIQLDVYTCGNFDPHTVFEWLKQYNPIRVDYKYLDRENGLTEIPLEPKNSYSWSSREIVDAMDTILAD